MGAEPGRRFLKQPAEKLKAVLLLLIRRDESQPLVLPLKTLTSIKKLWETRGMTYELLLEIFSMEILHSLLYRNWSVNFYRITPFHFGKARLFLLHVTVCCKPRDRLRQKPRQTRWVILSVRSAEWPLQSGFVEQCCSCVQWRSYICAKFW